VRKVIKVLAAIVVIGVLLVVGVLVWLTTAFPKVAPAPTLSVATTPERLARGKYVFSHVAACVACHSQRDASAFAGPVVPGSEGQGGEPLGPDDGVPGTVYASNLTPAGLSAYSDGELFRAITCGVTRDGRALFPIMPYTHYRDLAREDVEAVIAYVRTLPPVTRDVPAGKLLFPMSIIVRTIPKDADPPAKAPERADPAYGAYVVNAAACIHCHSQSDHGQPVAGREYAGGVSFTLAGGTIVRSANITPDEETGIGRWTREQFVQRFRAFAGRRVPLAAGQANTPMPWTDYGGMSEDDLGAIYDFLRTVKPVKNKVLPAAAKP
jgi:cytochrome c553